MKIKDLISYSFYQENVTKDYIELHSHIHTVTIKNLSPNTIQYKAEDMVNKFIRQAIKEVGLKGPDSIDEDLIFRRLRQLSKEHLRVHKLTLYGEGFIGQHPKQFNNEDLADAFKLFINSAKLYKIAHAIEHTSYKSSDIDLAEDLVMTWTGVTDPLVSASLKHFIWQIKRKLNSSTVDNHLMIILYGSQGCGKTRAIRALIETFSELGLCIASSISQFVDERYLKVLNDNYVCFTDEMANADKADINALKNIITAERLHPRILGKNAAFDIQQNCTIIGASNKPVNEMIFDNTGMRRFLQINCQAKMDWTVINNFDYLSLIKSVDENNEEGYLTADILAQLKVSQQNLVSFDDIHYFFQDNPFQPAPIKKGSFICGFELYRQYILWTQDSLCGFQLSKYEFIKKIKNRGFIEDSKKVNGKTQRGFWYTHQEVLEVSETLLLDGAK